MYKIKQLFLSDKFKFFLILALCGIGTIWILAMYIGNNDNNIIFYSVLFLLVIIINRVKNLLCDQSISSIYLYLSEFCFVTYVILNIINTEHFFGVSKLLLIPSMVIAVIQMFKLIRKEK